LHPNTRKGGAWSVAAATSLAFFRDDKGGKVCMARLKRLLKNSLCGVTLSERPPLPRVEGPL